MVRRLHMKCRLYNKQTYTVPILGVHVHCLLPKQTIQQEARGPTVAKSQFMIQVEAVR